MTRFVIIMLAVISYSAVTRFAPARIGARVGFWVSAIAVVLWGLDAVAAAFDHRWFSLSWNLLWTAICAFGAWCWADDLRRDRAKSTVNADGAS